MIVLLCLGLPTLFIGWIVLGLWWLIDGYLVYKYVVEDNARTGAQPLAFSFSHQRSDPDEQAITVIDITGRKLETLERLSTLRASGALTEDEFVAEKDRLLRTR
jgi:hypothetical protein